MQCHVAGISERYGENRIYYKTIEDNINQVYVMIVGPEDTPYHNGFYCFLATYPDDYPWSPIKVKFLTTESNSRMNPNLYGCGKVCLSILGTWSGPGWTSLMNIFIVFNSIIGEIFVREPFKNEPGHEKSSINVNEKYNNYLYHENLRLAIVNSFTKQTYIKNFDDVIYKYIEDHKDEYLKIYEFYKNQELINKDNKFFTTPLWRHVKILNQYDNLCDKFKDILKI